VARTTETAPVTVQLLMSSSKVEMYAHEFVSFTVFVAMPIAGDVSIWSFCVVVGGSLSSLRLAFMGCIECSWTLRMRSNLHARMMENHRCYFLPAGAAACPRSGCGEVGRWKMEPCL
jgi:hypothetical protein